MSTSKYHMWVLASDDGIQFKECVKCWHINKLEYHFDATPGDTVACENCGTEYEIISP